MADTQPLAPTDSELIAELGAAGVEFMAFRGGLCGTKEVWVTAGSQDAKKIAQGVRAARAKWGAPHQRAPALQSSPFAPLWQPGTSRRSVSIRRWRCQVRLRSPWPRR